MNLLIIVIIGNITSAYKMLSNECKEVIFYNNINYFKESYVDKVFSTKKNYYIQSWKVEEETYTYQVKIQEDILASGNVQSAIEDYYTIVTDEYKNQYLNINNYIGRTTINKQKTQNNITITATTKDVFKEYEIYNFEIDNQTDKTILLDTKQDTNSIYLLNEYNRKYNSFVYEVIESKLTIGRRLKTNVSIGFNKIYSNDKKIEKIVFEDIILDKDRYENEKYKNQNSITNEINNISEQDIKMKMSIDLLK